MSKGGGKEPPLRCFYCTTAEKLQSFHQLETGDHIRVGGRKFMFNAFGRQVALYYHHAIVTEVERLNATSAVLHVVAFQGSSFDADVTIREQIIGVNLKYDEIYIIRYGHDISPKPIIIKRAQMLLIQSSEKKYNVLSNNCEHFANFCCTGIKRSNQVNDALESIRETTKGPVQRVIRIAMKLSKISLEDISKAPVKKAFLGQYQIAVIVITVYLVFNLVKQKELWSDKKARKICQRCYKERTKDMWLRFVICFGSQAVGTAILALIISTGATGGVVLGATAIFFVVSMVLMYGIPKLRQMLQSPFKGQLVCVDQLTDDLRGNVISFNRFGLMHDGIVSNVVVYPHSDNKKGKLAVIHYSSATKYGQRTIVEEEIEFDLNETKIKAHDYLRIRVHPPDVVIKRARARIGETKFKFFSNRSCHFCDWAMLDTDTREPDRPCLDMPVGERRLCIRSYDPRESVSSYRQVHVDQRKSRVLSSTNITEREVWIKEEVKEGTVVRLKIDGKMRYGVTTIVAGNLDTPSEFVLFVIHRGSDGFLKEEPVEVDLKTDRVWVYFYPLAHQYSPVEVVKRAQQKVLAQRRLGMLENSFKVARTIAKKLRDVPVESFHEIEPGSVIIFHYWSKKHAAIVSELSNIAPCGQDATVTIVHYASTGIFRPVTVQEDTERLSLKSSRIFVRDYEGFVTYSNDMAVERARSCLGEQKYSKLSNTSWDLVHWAKVVNKPSIVTVDPDSPDNNNQDCKRDLCIPEDIVNEQCGDRSKLVTGITGKPSFGESNQYLLLPEYGKINGLFQRQMVRRWRDLKPGTIIEFARFVKKRQGILMEANENDGTVTVIRYKNHGYRDTVDELQVKLDLKRDHIWMYVCDPTKVNKQREILENARSCLSTEKFALRSGNWDFCQRCVLKPEYW